MIREFDAESCSHQTMSSATQSSRSEILWSVRRKSPHIGLNLHLSRHQRPVISSHKVRISAIYLCFEFRWCRERTLQLSKHGISPLRESMGLSARLLDDGYLHLHVAVAGAAVVVADDREVAGGVGRDGDVDGLVGGYIGIDFERLRHEAVYAIGAGQP